MDVAALVGLAGNTLVAAMVTDAWEDVRGTVARLFGRGEPDPGIERRLDAARDQLAAAAPGDLERHRADQASRWAGRLADLLEDYPDAEGELRALVTRMRGMLSPDSVSVADHSMASLGDIKVSGSGGLTAGIVHIEAAPPGPTPPGRA